MRMISLLLFILCNVLSIQSKTFQCDDFGMICGYENDTLEWISIKEDFDKLRTLDLKSSTASTLRQKHDFCTDDRLGFLLTTETTNWTIACIWTNKFNGGCFPAPNNLEPYDYIPRDEWRILLSEKPEAAMSSTTTATTATVIFFNATTISPSLPAEVTVDAYFMSSVILILAVIAMFGLFANLANVYITIKSPLLHNSFGYLCASHSIAEIVNLLIVGCWTIFVILIAPSLSESSLGLRIGQIAVGICLLTSYTVLFKTINRFTAIMFPFTYRKMFSEKGTKFIIALTWFLAICHAVVGFIDSCDFLLDTHAYIWYFNASACGQFLAFYIDFIYSCSIMFIVVILDTITLFALIKFTNNLAAMNQRASQQQKKKLDKRFFYQSCLTSLLQTSMLISFHLFSRYATTPWLLFLSTTFAWALCSALDGAVNCGFNFKHFKVALQSNSSGPAMVCNTKIPLPSAIVQHAGNSVAPTLSMRTIA